MKKSFKRIMKAGFMLVCMFAFLCAPLLNAFAGEITYEPAKKPRINSFKASKTMIKSGEKITLSWNVENADKVKLEGFQKGTEENLNLVDERTNVMPESTTTYVLTAEGKGGTSTLELTVYVNEVPKVEIVSFKANPTTVEPGKTTTLSWETKNAKSVSITGLEKEPEGLELTGKLTNVLPLTTTIYTLRAEGEDGKGVNATVEVKVNTTSNRAEIVYFDANKTKIKKGETAQLKWEVKNAQTINIKNSGATKFVSQGTLDVNPDKTTTYTLEAVGTDKVTVSQNVTIEVEGAVIKSFTASETTVSKGTLVKLEWTTENAKSCKIVVSDANGKEIMTVTDIGTNDFVHVTPNKTRIYKLVATGNDGITYEKSVTITVK